MLTNPLLKSKIDALWDRFWSGGISNPLTAIEQMSYLIFLKRLEDSDNARAASAKRRGIEFHSLFDGTMEQGRTIIERNTCRWSYWSQLHGEEILAHVRDVVFAFLRGLGSNTSAFTQYMQDAVFVIPKASLLQEALKIIDEMHISEQNIDVQGDLYEYLINHLSTAGKNGQFRTPRHIIRMMTKLLDPQMGERICDPAAGTAGFLVAAYEHILEMNTSPDILSYDEEGKAHNLIGDTIADPRLHTFLKGEAINGFDFDPTMVRIGAMNLMLHGVENPHFGHGDTLTKQYTERARYDCILANPPFKGSIDAADLSERFRLKTKKTELLFIELIYDLLRTGGRAAIIVPDGVLFGTSNAHVEARKILLDNCQLDALISMPSGVFKPYAGVSTAVLLFTKGERTNGNICFYDMKADGFSLDDKRQKTEANDIPRILHSYAQHKAGIETPNGLLLVAADDIRANKYDLSIARYKPIEYSSRQYEKPALLIEQILSIESQIAQLVNDIRGKV